MIIWRSCAAAELFARIFSPQVNSFETPDFTALRKLLPAGCADVSWNRLPYFPGLIFIDKSRFTTRYLRRTQTLGPYSSELKAAEGQDRDNWHTHRAILPTAVYWLRPSSRKLLPFIGRGSSSGQGCNDRPWREGGGGRGPRVVGPTRVEDGTQRV